MQCPLAVSDMRSAQVKTIESHEVYEIRREYFSRNRESSVPGSYSSLLKPITSNPTTGGKSSLLKYSTPTILGPYKGSTLSSYKKCHIRGESAYNRYHCSLCLSYLMAEL